MREIAYDDCVEGLLAFLDKNKIWTLATSAQDYVTSRSMSMVNLGLAIYFQTHRNYLKHRQMEANPEVSLCCQNYSIEGRAAKAGSWADEANQEVLAEYLRHHKGSYERYGSLEGEVLYKIEPRKVKIWEYVDGEPRRKEIWIAERKAFEIGYLD